jgi:uncharacterized protein (TIRG00374 family)
MEKRVYLLILVSVLILLGLFGAADINETVSILRTADLTVIAFSMASYTIAIVVFALIWHYLLKSADLKLEFYNNLRLVFSAVFFNVATPTASYGGEAVRAYLFSKKYKQDAGKGVATIVAHRIIGTLSNSLATLVVGIYLILFYSVPALLIFVVTFVTITSFLGFLLILYFGLRIEWSLGVVNRFFRLISRFRTVKDETRESAEQTLRSYHKGLSVLLKNRSVLLLGLTLGLVAWFFVNLVAVFALKAVGGSINVENFLLVFTFFSVSRLIPTGLPEFVGAKEAILAGFYSSIGLPLSTSVAVVVIIRLATQLWMVVLGGLITLGLGFEGFEK